MRSLLFAALLLPVLVHAQPDTSFTFTLRKFDVSDGLAHRRVNAVVQDRDGFLWIATPAGVQRFDGYTFNLLTTADGLQANDAGSIWLDGNGLIWLLYNEPSLNFCTGIDILDPRTGSIQRFEEHFSAAPVRATDLVHWMRYLPDSSMLIGARGRFVSYHPRRGFSVTPKRGDDYFNPLRKYADGSLLGVSFLKDIAFDRLLIRNADGTDRDTIAEQPAIVPLNGRERSLEEYLRAHPDGSVQGDYLAWRERMPGPVGEQWLPANGPMVPLRAGGGSDEPWYMQRKDLGKGLWLVQTTVRRMKPGDDPLSATVLFDLAERYPEITFRIHDAMQDAQGNLWLCTEFGLFRLAIRASRFQRMLWSADIPQGFGKRARGMIVQDDPSVPGRSRLLVNTEQEGFWALDAMSGHEHGQELTPMLRYAIATAPDGTIWRSCEDTVRQFRADGLTPTGREYLVPGGVWSLLISVEAMLRGGNVDLEQIDLRTGSRAWPAAACSSAACAALRSAKVMHLGRDRSGELWACTSNGLYRLLADGTPQERWSLEGDEAHRLPALDVRHFREYGTGIFWLATGDAGLLRWDRTKNEVRSISRKEGMPSSAMHAVYADGNGFLWMPTDNGLVRYDPGSERITVFTEADGISHHEFNRLAHAQGSDGRLYFGGLNGITAFDPKNVGERETQGAAPLHFTSIQQFSGAEDRIIDRSTDVSAGMGLTLRPGDRFLNIAFALLSYEDAQSILYAWRIDGVDKDWNYQHEPALRITSLPYGEHLLRIKAQGSNGIWGPKELTLPIRVVRPVHLRWWFITLLALGVAGILYVMFRFRLEQAKKVVTLRDRIAADLHDEVGSSLTNIAMFGELMRDQAADQSPQFKRMLDRVTTNSALALERMNDIVWNVHTRSEGTDQLVARMRGFAVQAAEAKGFTLKFVAGGEVEDLKLDMEQRKEVYLIFKEAVNNAAKYSGCTELRVELSGTGGKLRMVVTDNGRGFTKGKVDPNGGGNGLPGMERRARLIGARLGVETGEGRGAQVSLELGAS